jgi:hypothetical protein
MASKKPGRPGNGLAPSGLSRADLARLAAAVRELDRGGAAAPECAPPPRPSGSVPAAYLRAHRAPVLATAAVAGADLAVLAAHAAAGADPAWAYGAVLALSAGAGAKVAWTFRPARRRRRRARRYAAGSWALSSATALAGTAVGVASGPGQAVMLAGGLAVATPYLWHTRRRPETEADPIPDTAEPGPVPTGPDPRMEAFRQRFGRTGPCKDARLALTELRGGFALDLVLAPSADASTDDVIRLAPKIAALYDLPADHVSVEHGSHRSERRARITVLTARDALTRPQRWDGQPTYDPADGTIVIGRYGDSRAARYQLHQPGSGAASGVISGVTGSGKTGTAHVLACETGLARKDGHRIAANWMADPQEQPFGVWAGRADLLGWGPEGSVHLLLMAYAAMRARSAWLGQLRWADHLGRTNIGKGWFDPEPGLPLISMIVDEWPLLMADPALRKILLAFVPSLLKQSRKAGIGVTLITQLPDVSELGERVIREMLKAFNALSHRTDGLSRHMLGIQGDPSRLAPGVHGLGYLAGPDQRPGQVMRTKHLPEYLRPGQVGPDVRGLAENIAADPVALDDVVLAAIRPLGYTGPGQVLDGSGMLAAAIALGFADPAETAGPPPTPRHPAPDADGPAAGHPLHLPLLAALLRARGELDLFDISEAAGISVLDADRALAGLVSSGHAVRVGAGACRWKNAPARAS